ncbi:peroxisomal nicotinamide adenine dinucleotide carrier-like protein [Carex littledalei]|uniref:Peroxisomal nicotinamide adenine dinucleotide carrier-like protein n=1 Tax=Carex littledalei TaxID=544730 RepID=A0A833VAQ5_9POAL|nr:peroxisomal nicotinamide adenine dinucleotide carrier-like protein [Carex littledalei]
MSNAVLNGLAGAGGGIIAQIITYPLQTVNTRQQTERTAKTKSKTNQPSSSSDRGTGGSTLAQLLQLFQAEGLGGLYSGLKPSLLGTAASQGVYYYFYQLLKNKVEARAIARKKEGRGDGTVGMLSWLVVAAIAGSLNVLLTIPIWVLVTRMQTHTQAERKIMEARMDSAIREMSTANLSESEMKAKLAELASQKPCPYGTFLAAREVYNEAGIRGFWKGIIPTLVMVCNPSIQFMIYETSVKQLQAKRSSIRKQPNDKKLSALEVFLLGALAKLSATVATYPLLVVKSRLQAKQEIGRDVMSRYTGTIDAIMKIIRFEGLHVFYKGMGTKIVQSVFAASVLFMLKEELVKFFLFIARIRHIRAIKSKDR